MLSISAAPDTNSADVGPSITHSLAGSSSRLGAITMSAKSARRRISVIGQVMQGVIDSGTPMTFRDIDDLGFAVNCERRRHMNITSALPCEKVWAMISYSALLHVCRSRDGDVVGVRSGGSQIQGAAEVRVLEGSEEDEADKAEVRPSEARETRENAMKSLIFV